MSPPCSRPASRFRRRTAAYLRLDLGFLERQASAAVMAFYNALAYVTSYFGWHTSVHDGLTAKIDETMPTFFA